MDPKSIIAELLEKGMTQAEIGRSVGRSQPWVGMVLTGAIADIKSSAAEKLRTLQAERRSLHPHV